MIALWEASGSAALYCNLIAQQLAKLFFIIVSKFVSIRFGLKLRFI